MNTQNTDRQAALTERISTFLTDHFYHCYSLQELEAEPYLAASGTELQDGINFLLKKGKVKRVKDGQKVCYLAKI